jgi:hypothetical protein
MVNVSNVVVVNSQSVSLTPTHPTLLSLPGDVSTGPKELPKEDTMQSICMSLIWDPIIVELLPSLLPESDTWTKQDGKPESIMPSLMDRKQGNIIVYQNLLMPIVRLQLDPFVWNVRMDSVSMELKINVLLLLIAIVRSDPKTTRPLVWNVIPDSMRIVEPVLPELPTRTV